MQADRYTKVMLTVIAACFLALVLRSYGAIPQLHATGASSQVVDVNIAEIDGQGFGLLQVSTFRPALPVRFQE